ncbi:MAG: family 43 glycosylhydrolase [Brevinema sp.]
MNTNPIFRGFNPDPCIIRGEDAWYVAVSTFEYTPGVRIYRSEDLTDWELLGGALTTYRQLDLHGVPSSGGVWAPGLSYADHVYWLVYTNVKDWSVNRATPFLESHNFLVTTTDPKKGWGDPIYLHSRGFDPDLFHDDDGRKWLLSINWNPRGQEQEDWTNGIIIQEFDPIQGKCIGDIHQIFKNSGISINSEGPHIYKRNNFYYLVVAEGGTDWGHMACVARAKNILGSYESSPYNPLITSSYDASLRLQKSGHVSFACTHEDQWIMTYLCSRPIPQSKFCPLGRETAIQQISWINDWPIAIDQQGAITQNPINSLPLKTKVFQEDHNFLNFQKQKKLAPYWSGVRSHIDGTWHRFEDGLVITGKGSPTSVFAKSEIVRRITELKFEVAIELDFLPQSFQSMAGLIVRYDESQFYYLGRTQNVYGEQVLRLLIREQEPINKASTIYHTNFIDIPFSGEKIKLRCICQDDYIIRFSYRENSQAQWINIAQECSLYKLSDDYVSPLSFTGSFVGMGVHDMTGTGVEARFLSFQYRASEV